MPEPHVLEHDPHDPQYVHEQSTGQLCVLHDVVEVEDPEHWRPPLYGPFFDLERLFVPVSHDLEHDPHDLQFSHEQSTGQLLVLHDVVEVEDPEH